MNTEKLILERSWSEWCSITWDGTDMLQLVSDQIVSLFLADKPTILVVMHHTFDPNHTVAESRRQVTNPNVRLTVDYLFHERELLDCPLNQISRGEIKNFLQISTTVVNAFNDLLYVLLKVNMERTDCWYRFNLWYASHVAVWLLLVVITHTLFPFFSFYNIFPLALIKCKC